MKRISSPAAAGAKIPPAAAQFARELSVAVDALLVAVATGERDEALPTLDCARRALLGAAAGICQLLEDVQLDDERPPYDGGAGGGV